MNYININTITGSREERIAMVMSCINHRNRARVTVVLVRDREFYFEERSIRSHLIRMGIKEFADGLLML